MATKIEGWANGNPAYPGRHHSFTDLNSGVGVKATLVIGDERVFTESEVRDIVDRIGRANCLPEALYSWAVYVAKGAGVSFDPANAGYTNPGPTNDSERE